MSLQIIYASVDQLNKYEEVSRDARNMSSHFNGVNVFAHMGRILDDACINTNHTFEDSNVVTVSVDEWNAEFIRNVEFCMSQTMYDPTAISNLKHYGFKP